MRNKTMFLIALLLFATSSTVFSSDADDAKSVAGTIMSKISNGDYKDVWENHVSNWFKSKITKDSFLANLSISRSMLGNRQDSKLVDVAYSKNDPATGYQGDIYAFTYKNKYQSTTLYERIVLIKENDKGFVLSGFWGNPAQ